MTTIYILYYILSPTNILNTFNNFKCVLFNIINYIIIFIYVKKNYLYNKINYTNIYTYLYTLCYV